jgi:hypothetical protein
MNSKETKRHTWLKETDTIICQFSETPNSPLETERAVPNVISSLPIKIFVSIFLQGNTCLIYRIKTKLQAT